MAMRKELENAIRFAVFCREHKIPPHGAAVLVTLAEAAFRAGERACNEPDSGNREQKAAEEFEQAAKQLGFGVQWNGLWPTLMNGERDANPPLPCFN